MSYSRAERKRVYVAWGGIFSSLENSGLRKQKAIRNVIEHHRPGSQRTEPNAVAILQSLLQEGVIQYHNTSNARREFPELFQPSSSEAREEEKETAPRPSTTAMFGTADLNGESQRRLLRSLEQ